MRAIAINEAEAILDPFWDRSLSELNQWTVEPGAHHGLRVWQNWCWVAFEWARRPANGPAVRMSRRCEVNCADYDRLVLSVMAPPDAVVRLLAETDSGPRRLDAPPAMPPRLVKAFHVDAFDGASSRLVVKEPNQGKVP